MTKIRRPYSRVYWEVIDDPKFADVWDDDRAIASWLRLLLAADMAWPASAQVYHGVHRPSLDKLVRVGLVDLQPGSRYRIHGLDKERQARSGQAATAAAARWDEQPTGNADGMRPHPVSNAQGMPSKDETRRDEQKPSESARSDAFDAVEVVEGLTNRPFGFTVGSRVFDTLAADVKDFGLDRVLTEYRAVKDEAPGPVDAAGVVFGGHKRLFPIPDGPRPLRAPAKGKGFNPTSDEAWDAFGGKDVA